MIDPTGNDKTLREPGTRELIRLIKDALDNKADVGDLPPIASTSSLGVIKVGTNLSITSDGTLNAAGGGGGSVVVDDHIDGNSTNPVQNKVIKTALDTKLDKTEATISSGIITIQEHQLVPITPAEVETMWGSVVPPQPSSGLNVSSMVTPVNNINTLDIAGIGSQTIIGT